MFMAGYLLDTNVISETRKTQPIPAFLPFSRKPMRLDCI